MVDRLATPIASARTGYAPVITPTTTPHTTPAEPPPSSGLRRRLHDSRVALVAFAAATLLVHVVANFVTPYGLHRDELLYLAMGRHLRFWAMDFPPGIGLVAYVTDVLLGSTLSAVRLPSALAATALVTLTFVVARMFGGPRRAAVLAALAVLCNPLFLRTGTLFQPVVFDQLWWTLGLAALVRMGGQLATRPRRPSPPVPHSLFSPQGVPEDVPAWIVLGIAMGFGLLTKFSIVFFGVGVAAGVLATPPLRERLRTPWPWVALAIALVIGAPSLVGQFVLGWPVVGQMAELRSTQLSHVGPLDFVLGQLVQGPAVLLAGLGLWALLRYEITRPWRAAGIACAVAFVLLLLTRGKPYYASPLYPTLFAVGAAAFERRVLALSTVARRRLARGAAYAAIVLYGLVTLPFGLPVLPPAAMARYAAAFGGAGTSTNTGGRLTLPQDYADMLGWPQQAAAVNAVIDALPPARRNDVALLARNYGEAGALDYYGPALGLPQVVSPAGSFWYFGPPDAFSSTIVAVGFTVAELTPHCRRVTLATRIQHDDSPWVVPEERGVPVAVCEDPVQSLAELWPTFKP